MTFRAIDPAVAKIYYAEEADRPISTLNIPDGSLVIFTDSGLEDSFDSVANAWFNREQITQAGSGKTAGLVVVANQGVLIPTDMDNSLNRGHLTAGTARVKNTWTAAENVGQITITARNAANPVTDYTSAANTDHDVNAHWMSVTFNAPDDTTAATWLGHVVTDAGANKLYLVQIGRSRTFSFSAPLERIDYKRAIGSMNLQVTIDATAGS